MRGGVGGVQRPLEIRKPTLDISTEEKAHLGPHIIRYSWIRLMDTFAPLPISICDAASVPEYQMEFWGQNRKSRVPEFSLESD